MLDQAELFSTVPAGFRYRPDILSAEEEAGLAERIGALSLKPFEFNGHLGRRRVISFGMRYSYQRRDIESAAGLPDFLLPLRDRVARFAGYPADAFVHTLITEYSSGAGIGWHRDKPQFADVVGVSLLASCILRFRRRAGARWERLSVPLTSRSAYLLTGPARHDWQHSIAPQEALRYSITFRTLSASGER